MSQLISPAWPQHQNQLLAVPKRFGCEGCVFYDEVPPLDATGSNAGQADCHDPLLKTGYSLGETLTGKKCDGHIFIIAKLTPVRYLQTDKQKGS